MHQNIQWIRIKVFLLKICPAHRRPWSHNEWAFLVSLGTAFDSINLKIAPDNLHVIAGDLASNHLQVIRRAHLVSNNDEQRTYYAACYTKRVPIAVNG